MVAKSLPKTSGGFKLHFKIPILILKPLKQGLPSTLIYIENKITYSVFKLFIGFANAAFTDWKLTVSSVIATVPRPVITNIQPDIVDR